MLVSKITKHEDNEKHSKKDRVLHKPRRQPGRVAPGLSVPGPHGDHTGLTHVGSLNHTQHGIVDSDDSAIPQDRTLCTPSVCQLNDNTVKSDTGLRHSRKKDARTTQRDKKCLLLLRLFRLTRNQDMPLQRMCLIRSACQIHTVSTNLFTPASARLAHIRSHRTQFLHQLPLAFGTLEAMMMPPMTFAKHRIMITRISILQVHTVRTVNLLMWEILWSLHRWLLDPSLV